MVLKAFFPGVSSTVVGVTIAALSKLASMPADSKALFPGVSSTVLVGATVAAISRLASMPAFFSATKDWTLVQRSELALL